MPEDAITAYIFGDESFLEVFLLKYLDLVTHGSSNDNFCNKDFDFAKRTSIFFFFKKLDLMAC